MRRVGAARRCLDARGQQRGHWGAFLGTVRFSHAPASSGKARKTRSLSLLSLARSFPSYSTLRDLRTVNAVTIASVSCGAVTCETMACDSFGARESIGERLTKSALLLARY